MYGLIGSILVLPENRAALVSALLSGSQDMPGCLSYVVAEDTQDDTLVWVTEVWESMQARDASLRLPQVLAATEQAKHVVLGFGKRHVTRPVSRD